MAAQSGEKISPPWLLKCQHIASYSSVCMVGLAWCVIYNTEQSQEVSSPHGTDGRQPLLQTAAQGATSALACFHSTAQWRKTLHSKMLRKIKEKKLWHMEIKWNSNKMTINKVLLAHSPIIGGYTLSLLCPNSRVMIVTIWPTKHKRFTFSPFTKKKN